MRLFKPFAAFLAASVVLSSCGTVVDTAPSSEKTAFFFESRKFSEFPKTAEIRKIGRIVGSSSVTVTSQGIGRIESLPLKEGATVKKGQVIASLSDTVANYALRYDQAQNGVRNAAVNAESTEIALNKAVADAETNLSRVQIDYDRTVADAAKQLEKAKRDTEKTTLSFTGSDSQTALAKAELDYENLKKSNAKTIENYAPTYRVAVSDFKKLVSSVLFDSDRLLGVSEQNRSYNDAFETYLGARDSSTVSRALAAYARTVEVSKFLDSKTDLAITEGNVVSELAVLEPKYAEVRSLLDANVRVLENSIPATALSQASIDAYIATHNAYKSSLSGLENAFVAFKNSSTSFLSTYQNNEASALAGIEVQRKNLASGQYDAGVGYDRTKISINAGTETARLALETAKANLENARKNRTATLEKLEVSKIDAALQLNLAGIELGKLRIVSPIDATVVRVVAQVGQDVATGTPIVELSSRSPEVVIDVDASTAGLLQTPSVVSVTSGENAYTGTVVGVSKVANTALLFTVRIVLSETPKLLGEAATVAIPLPSPYPVVSADIVKILSEQSGELTAYSGGTFVPVGVKL
jgi:multidrug efflux pump subunit AcrA (membrane-fusion protein)